MSMSSTNVSNVDNNEDNICADDNDDDMNLSEASVICCSSPQVFPLPGLHVQLYTLVITDSSLFSSSSSTSLSTSSSLSGLHNSVVHLSQNCDIVTFATSSSSQKPTFEIIFASELPESASSWTQQCSRPQRSSG